MSDVFTTKYFFPCVKNFVSTVLLIDDQLSYSEPEPPSLGNMTVQIPVQGESLLTQTDNNGLPASKLPEGDVKRTVYVTELIKYFSKEELLVTPINPKKIDSRTKTDCVETLLKLAEKADAIILDWDMSVKFEDGSNFTDNELPIQLINKLSADNKYRLVIIYTADTEETVKQTLSVSDNIEVQVYGKSNTTGNNIKTYEELAVQVNNDFLSKKRGLLGAALLTSLTSLRKSTYLMLNSLKSDYDEALLYHRALLDKPDKITDFCKDIINDEIISHIDDVSTMSFFSREAFKDFINETGKTIIVKEKPGDGEQNLPENYVDALLDKGYKSFFPDESQALIANGDMLNLLIHDSKDEIMKSFSYYSTTLFPDAKPKLKLGCVVEYNENFFLCIQPPCDSERIKSLSATGKCPQPQNFLFLKLEKKEKKVSFYVKKNSVFQGVRLRYKCVETFPFAGDKNGFVSMNEYNDFVTYSPSSENQISLHYLCCLKPMFAQKIANEFAANISRVGIDQFEWLRLK